MGRRGKWGKKGSWFKMVRGEWVGRARRYGQGNGMAMGCSSAEQKVGELRCYQANAGLDVGCKIAGDGGL